jgi:hypothetical protein
MHFFGGELKLSVPYWSFEACKIILQLRVSHHL